MKMEAPSMGYTGIMGNQMAKMENEMDTGGMCFRI